MVSLGCCKAGSGCDVGRCGACFFDRNFEKLKNEHPWLEYTKDPFGVGCSVCRKFYKNDLPSKKTAGSEWRKGSVTMYNSLQNRRLCKHEESLDHKRAEQKNAADCEATLAPTQAQCKDLLAHARKSPLGTQGVPSVGGQKKCRKLLWCLAESHRDFKREWFRSGKGIDGSDLMHSTTIFQDARKGQLSVRFTTANTSCDRGEGLFGVADLAGDFSLDSVGVMKATMSIIRFFCTRRKFPPHLEKQHEAQIDRDLFTRVVASIETFVSDAASDELRAGHMLARQSTASEYMPRFPFLKVIIRDKPHATRRFMSRGWKADGFLHEVAERFVFQPGSPTRLVQYSDLFKAWFASSIKLMDPEISTVALSKHIHDLGFAAHRFESASKPMSRICLFFHAFLTTVNRIAWERKGGEEGRQAEAFCRWLDVEKCVQFAMLADCSLENIHLTRLLDYQGFPVEQLGGYLESYKERVRGLFAGDDPLCKTIGCCGQMLKILQRKFSLSLPGPVGSNQFVVGEGNPVPTEIVQRCLQRMCNWICVMEETLQAEFPHFEIIQGFSAFNVKGDVEFTTAWRDQCSRKLCKLQRAFGCQDDERGAVLKQFEKLWYIARRAVLDEGFSSIEGWIAAVQKVTRTNSKMHIKEILTILVRYWAAGGSTSGVEQAFTQGRNLFDNLQLIHHVKDVMEAGWDGAVLQGTSTSYFEYFQVWHVCLKGNFPR